MSKKMIKPWNIHKKWSFLSKFASFTQTLKSIWTGFVSIYIAISKYLKKVTKPDFWNFSPVSPNLGKWGKFGPKMTFFVYFSNQSHYLGNFLFLLLYYISYLVMTMLKNSNMVFYLHAKNQEIMLSSSWEKRITDWRTDGLTDRRTGLIL